MASAGQEPTPPPFLGNPYFAKSDLATKCRHGFLGMALPGSATLWGFYYLVFCCKFPYTIKSKSLNLRL